MARLEIETNNPAQFAEVLYYAFSKSWERVGRGKLPDWASLGRTDQDFWIIMARQMLAAYMMPVS